MRDGLNPLQAVVRLFMVFSPECAFQPYGLGKLHCGGDPAQAVSYALSVNTWTSDLRHPAVKNGLKSKEDNEQLAQWLEIQFRETLRVPGAKWPEENRYRFVREDDPTFEDYFFNNLTNSYSCRTPEKYVGLSRDGVYENSCRVQFTVPGKDDHPTTVELLRYKGKATSCGAVRVKLPLDARLVFRDSYFVVKNITDESNAQNSSIMVGDIIRAVSLPVSRQPSPDAPWWAPFGALLGAPEAEEGMVMLDGKSEKDYEAAIQENIRVNGPEAEVVLLLERPADVQEQFWDDLLDTAVNQTMVLPIEDKENAPSTATAHSADEKAQKDEKIKQLAMKTAESVKLDVQRILRVEPNWKSFTPDLELVDPSGTRLRLPQIKDLLNIVRNFIGIFVAEEDVDIKFRFAESVKPVMAAKGTIEVRGGQLPPPLPRSFSIDVEGSCLIYFNNEGQVREVDVDKWSFNGRELELPRLGRGDPTKLSPQDYLELLLWTRKAIFGW